MKGISKAFPGVKALEEVSLRVQAGEIHGLVGENGAGKSTLMKVLSGVHGHGSYQGELLLDGLPQRFRGIRDSGRAGIAIIHQELALVPGMTVYENIHLGHELTRGFRIDWNETVRTARDLLRRVRLDVDPATPAGDLGVGQQQLVATARAERRGAQFLIFDEPTAYLTRQEAAALFRLIRRLKARAHSPAS